MLRVDMNTVGLAAPARDGDGVCLVVFRGSEADMSDGRRVTKHCEIVLTGLAVPAGREVQIAATSSANSVLFDVHIGGELQVQGRHVAIRYEPGALC